MASGTKPTTLADMVAQHTGEKRKREATHVEGIPVACILESEKTDGVREIRTSRRVGSAGEQGKVG